MIIIRKFYFFLLAHHLSNIKYQIEFASGSTIASVRAIINVTSATNIKTVIAIAKCPIVYITVRKIDPLLLSNISLEAPNRPLVIPSFFFFKRVF